MTETQAIAVFEEPMGHALPALDLWDPAAFEQTERVAQIMANSGLMPQALTHIREGQGQNAPLVALAPEVVFARAVLIANQAKHLGVDPVLFAQCCAIVHGRLMYEGKLVHAIIEQRLGVRLRYDFGLWHTDHFEAVANEEALWGAQERLAVRVVGRLPGEDFDRTVEGSVGAWKTAQWGPAVTWRQRLRYRGAREWSRAHQPGIMLGIVATDEAEELEAVVVGAAEARAGEMTPQLPGAGLIEGSPAPRKPRAQRAKAPEPAAEQLPAHNPTTGEILEGDDLPEGLKTDAKATAQGGDVIISGPAPAGVLHFLASADALDDKGMRLTFRDGARWNTAKPSADLPVYAELTEIKEEIAAGNAEATAGAPSAAAEPASSGSVTPASGGSPAETSASLPADDEGEPLAPEIEAYAAQVRAATDFPAVKAALITLQKTPLWKAMSNAEADEVRWNTWDLMEASGLAAKVDPAGDVSAFRLWVEWCEDPEEIDAKLAALESHPDFQAKPDATKENIRGATKARLERLEPA